MPNILFQSTSADGTTVALSYSVNGTARTFSTTNANVQAQGKAGVQIQGTSVTMPQQGISRLRIEGWSGSAWVTLANIDYTSKADTAAGAATDAADGLTDTDDSYYIQGGRLRRAYPGSLSFVPRVLPGSEAYNLQRVMIESDYPTPGTATSANDRGGVTGVLRYTPAAGWHCHAGWRAFDAPGVVADLFGGIRNASADATTDTASSSSGALTPNTPIVLSPTGKASVSGNVVSITKPDVFGSGAWAWKYSTSALATTGTTAASGSGAIADLAYTMPAPDRGVLQYFWLEIAGLFIGYLSGYTVSGSLGVYVPAQAAALTPLDNTALAALVAGVSWPVGQLLPVLLGDSITAQNTTQIDTILTAVCPGRFHALINGGKSGSVTSDWLPSAAVSGTAISVLDNTKNNYDGVVAARAALGLTPVWSMAVGINGGSTANLSTTLTALLAIGGFAVVHQTTSRFDSQQLNLYADQRQTFNAGVKALWTASSVDKLYPGSDQMPGYFADNSSQLSDGLHPASGAGQDAWARFVVESILRAVAVEYAGGATLSAGSIFASGGLNQAVISAGTAPSGGTAPYTRRIGYRTPSGTGAYTYQSVAGTGPWTITGLSAGAYGFRLEVTDSASAVAYSTEVTATVSAPGDTTPPTVSSASINGAGVRLTVTLSETTSETTPGQGWTLKVNGSSRAAIWSRGSGTTLLADVIAPTILSTDTVTLDYSSSSGDCHDTAGNALATITGRAVTNGSTQSAGGGSSTGMSFTVLLSRANAGLANNTLSIQFYGSDGAAVGSALTTTFTGSGYSRRWSGTVPAGAETFEVFSSSVVVSAGDVPLLLDVIERAGGPLKLAQEAAEAAEVQTAPAG